MRSEHSEGGVSVWALRSELDEWSRARDSKAPIDDTRGAPASLDEAELASRRALERSTAREGAPSVVVVLPFEVPAGRDEIESIATEIREAIVTRLKELSGFAVVAASSLSGVERTGSSAEVCALLEADWLIEGRLKGYRDSVQLSILMTRARDRAYVWGGLFGFEPRDLERLSYRVSDEVWDEIRRRTES